MRIFRNIKTGLDIMDKIFPEGFEKAFDENFDKIFSEPTPPVNQDFFSKEIEGGKQYAILLPGATKDNVKISIDGENIILQSTFETWFKKYVVKKKILVGFLVEPSKVVAEMKNGILTIVVYGNVRVPSNFEVKIQ